MKYFISLLSVMLFLMTSCKKEAEQESSTTPTNVVPFTEVGRQMQNQSQTIAQPQNTSPQTGAVAPGMNPAHGQPGHRCDIAVGAPLNAPVATTQTTVKQNATAPAPTVTTTAAPVETTPTPEGMNPPHGQTNHRCDIAVGAPLPK
ncbi:hypothetical protein SAMN05444395_107137 [Flavobacterium fryxellicola]|uniref:Uncharacterized protein n=1 Tax=Flavobacterium fryxellicola TaxID=249352 RepID=A0A167YTH7_9FLAO|nr:hypothetical protein [Flavobacterium fryxellicola]OAB29771.1 hypothetical protein FBFR_03355 [Flavobacterium fryxellicola]SHN72914.1 hypothetical protein SAMN05444395_107137 [Flavobacterium fryxellicola]